MRMNIIPSEVNRIARRFYTFLIAIPIWLAPLWALADTDYRLDAGDEIRIQVHEEDDLSMTLRLGESGSFNYPYLGLLNANDKTLAELKNELTRGLLKDILVKPSVNVSIVAYRNFYIGGEVKRSGGYPYQPGLNVRQAITLAGGVTEWASSSKFEILREGSSQPESATNKTNVRHGDTVTVLEGIF
jgi:polysaccharide biosynthesis/export protein VpsN